MLLFFGLPSSNVLSLGNKHFIMMYIISICHLWSWTLRLITSTIFPMTFKYDFYYERLNGIIRICSALCILLIQIVLKATKKYIQLLILFIPGNCLDKWNNPRMPYPVFSLWLWVSGEKSELKETMIQHVWLT